MEPYPLRWQHLQRGRSVEDDVRKLIARLSYRMSRDRIARVACYLPAVDIDGVDALVRVQTSNWTMLVEIAVRSASKPQVDLGHMEEYGTLRRWLSRSALHQSPALLFYFDWSRDSLSVLTPKQIRDLSDCLERRYFKAPQTTRDAETELLELLTTVATQPDEAAARRLLL